MDNRSTICLNMIVKNESHIIEKTLNNIISKINIDYWVISDTGSQDNTCEIITKFFKKHKIPGELFEDKWLNFGHNRTKALEYAFNKTDYLFIFDADDEIIGDMNLPPHLTRDKYFLTFGESFSYIRPLLVNNRKRWIFEGVLHEYLTNAKDETCEPNGCSVIGNYYIQSNRLGDRSNDPDKYVKDAGILKIAFDEEIGRNYGLACRYSFYCANSYKDAGPAYANDAIYWYKKCVSLNGWEQEKWNAYFQLGLINRALGNLSDAIYFWLEGYNCVPDRIENLCEITKYYRETGRMKLAFEFYKLAKTILDKNLDRTHYLFVYNDVYTYKLEYEYTIIACYVNVPKNINNQVITVLNNCNEQCIVDNLLSNMKFYKDILNPLREIVITYKISQNNEQFSSSTPTIIKGDYQGYLLNLRFVNYNYSSEGNLCIDGKIRTINKRYELDDDFNTLREHIVHIPKEDNNKRYLGIEDIKLFRDSEVTSNNVLFIATGTASVGDSNIKTLIGNYTDKLEEIELKQHFKKTTCEKNWVLFKYKGELCVIYEWFPLTICKFVKPFLESVNQEVIILERKPMPLIFNRARGSTNGYMCDNGEIWFVIHIVSYETPRHYYHVFVVFDENMNLLRYSAPFKFKGEPIEYCCGLIVEKERVICTFSNWDRTSYIGIYDRKYIENKQQYKNIL